MKKDRSSSRGTYGQEDTDRETNVGARARYRLYLLLGGITLGVGLLAVLLPHVPLIERFGANLATETLGILLTVIIVHRFLERDERARRMRGAVRALRRTAVALRATIYIWQRLLKTVLPANQPAPRTIRELLQPSNTEHLIALEPTAPWAGEERTRLLWAVDELEDAKRALSEVMLVYGSVLDAHYVEAVDELLDDPFVHNMSELVRSSPGRERWRVGINLMRGYREAYFAKLVHTVKRHNMLAAEAAAARPRHHRPRSPALGMELAADEDLRVEEHIDDRSWARTPA